MKVKPKILIADDSVMNQQMLTEILGDSYEYLYADNGLQALEVLNELHRIFDVARLVDPLTSLLNRRSFDCAMHRVRGRVAVIFLWMAIVQGAGHGNIRCAVSLPVKSGAQRRGDMMDAIDVVKGTVDIADKVVDRFPQTAVILKGQCQGIETVVDLVDFLNTIVLNGAAGANVQLAVVIR